MRTWSGKKKFNGLGIYFRVRGLPSEVLMVKDSKIICILSEEVLGVDDVFDIV